MPTLHLLFHPQSPVLTHHERLSPTLLSGSHSSKVTPINSICQLLHHTVKSFLSITASTKTLHCISIPHLKEMMVSHLKLGCCVWQMKSLNVSSRFVSFRFPVIRRLLLMWLHSAKMTASKSSDWCLGVTIKWLLLL